MRIAAFLAVVCLAAGALAAGEDHLLAGAQLFRDRRFQEAYVEFTVAARLGAGGDAAWYAAALACYEARLFLCADRLLESVGDRTGPRIGAQARKMRADIAALLATEPSADSIDWYHAHGAAARKEGRHSLAALYYTEAAALSRRRQDRHREAEARASLAELRKEIAP